MTELRLGSITLVKLVKGVVSGVKGQAHRVEILIFKLTINCGGRLAQKESVHFVNFCFDGTRV